MNINEFVEQAKALSHEERENLINQLIAMQQEATTRIDKPTSDKIAAKIRDMEPIELVDSHIEDPVEWLKVQRQKRQDRLKPYWNDTSQ